MVLPHRWLEKPRFSWGRECNGQLIREGSMAEESLKYLLSSALRRGVGRGEGDSGGWRRDLTRESSRSHSGALVGSGLLPHRHFVLDFPSWSRGRPSPERLCDLSRVSQPGFLPPQL